MALAKQFLIVTGLVVIGMIGALIFNFFILERVIIPDPCYYHYRDTTMIFDLFYEMKAVDGGHPSPTKFNFILTLAAGSLIGLFAGRRKVID
jgi:hypothetical protein